MICRIPSAPLALVLIALSFSACNKQAATDKTASSSPAAGAASAIESVDQKVSYGIGYNIGSGLGRDGVVQVDQAVLMEGIKDGLAGAQTRVPETELDAAFTSMQQRAAAAAAVEAEKQLAAGNEFLAKNKARAGVTETASGLQYEVLVKGSGGPQPKETDTVKVHYTGTLVDGTVFDSSVERGEPIEFGVNGVIPGWTEALQLMSVGDKWKLTIPSAIGYGPRANGRIPANAVLLFDVELLEIK